MKHTNLLLLCIVFGCIAAIPSKLNAQWSLSGNAATNPASNFIGTTDNVDFAIRTKNVKRLTIKKDGTIGINTTTPIAQLELDNSKNINSVYITNSSPNGSQYGVRVRVDGALAGSSRTAGEFAALGSGSTNTGLSVQATSANTNYGGNFNALSGANANIALWGYTGGPIGSKNFAVYGSIGASSTGNDYAGYFAGRTYSSGQLITGASDLALPAQVSVRAPSSLTDGVYVVSEHPTGNGVYSTYVGSPTNFYAVWGNAPSGNNQAGYFSGNVTVTGTFSNPSDEKLKQDIQAAPALLDKVLRLTVKTYSFKKEYDFMNLPRTKQLGFIAQNIEGIFPELVQNTVAKNPDGKDAVNLKTVNYIAVIPILTKALQEEHTQLLQTQDVIKKLSDENDALKRRLDAIESKMGTATTAQNSSMMQSKSVVARLEQNAPNPFNQSAIIKCYVPETAGNASLIIYSASGVQMKTFGNLTKGANQLSIAAGSLPSGSYSYALFVDGKKVDSRQMVVAK